MNPKCIEAVQRAAAAMGRAAPLTAAQLAEIDSRLRATMRRLAASDPDWQGKTPDQRMMAAATRAMQDVQHEAGRKLANAQLQILKTAATEGRIAKQLQLYAKSTRTEALARDMVNVDSNATALKATTFSRLIDLMDAVRDRTGAGAARRVSMFLFDAQNPAMTRDLAHEIYRNADGSTGNKVAEAGARAWLKVMDEMRLRFNAAGGDVGKLDYGWIPIAHNARRAALAGRDAWVAKVLPLVDRRRYVDEAGARLTDAQLVRVLGDAWETISSDGLNKQKPGDFKSTGARANRGSESRVIHFKDGDAYLTYVSQFGRGSMYDMMMHHVGGIARDIGLLENYGPNPNAQMRLQFDLAARADGGQMGRVGFGVGILRVNPEGLWRTMNGSASTPGSELGAQVFQHIRNVQSLKLASTFLKMFPDLATYFITTGYNKQSYWQAIANLGRSASKDTREWAAMHGLMADSGMREISRFMGENIGNQWSARLSNSQMKLTLGEAWTNWLDRAAGLSKMGALGRMASTEWHSLNQWDRIHLERAGITAADWAAVNLTKPELMNGIPMLTPDAIIASGLPEGPQVANKVLAAIRQEIDMSVIKPDLYNRAAQTWNGTQAGTGLGEIARCVMQFKSFPMAMVTRHWRRMLNAPTVTDGSAPALANRLLYTGALAVSATALGAISLQATQIAMGKDPIDWKGTHALKFWTQAFSIGGAGGFYGDLLTRDSTSDRSATEAVAKSVGGPTLGDVADLYQLTKGNIDEHLAGKQTHAAAEAVRMVRSHLPYVNMWYAKAAVDHAGMHALQESLSPGYLEKMRSRAIKDWNERYWWTPGSNGPDRAPGFSPLVP